MNSFINYRQHPAEFIYFLAQTTSFIRICVNIFFLYSIISLMLKKKQNRLLTICNGDCLHRNLFAIFSLSLFSSHSKFVTILCLCSTPFHLLFLCSTFQRVRFCLYLPASFGVPIFISISQFRLCVVSSYSLLFLPWDCHMSSDDRARANSHEMIISISY